MVQVGDKLKYIGGYVIGEHGMSVGDVFELTGVEKSVYNTFYCLENGENMVTLINEEVENFEVVK